jgi:hypothetical protein
MYGQSKAKTAKQYIAELDEPRKSEIAALDKLIQKATGLKPFMMGGILAYGPYHYVYASGREGDWAAVALASQKNYISLYACMAYNGNKGYVAESYKPRLPKANIGKSCVRFKRLSDVDPKALAALLKENHEVYKVVLKKQK